MLFFLVYVYDNNFFKSFFSYAFMGKGLSKLLLVIFPLTIFLNSSKVIAQEPDSTAARSSRKGHFSLYGGFGQGKFNDPSFDEEWGFASPISLGYKRYFTEKFRYDFCLDWAFNKITYKADGATVAYDLYHLLYTRAFLEMVNSGRDADFYFGGGFVWNDSWFISDALDAEKEKVHIGNNGFGIVVGAEMPRPLVLE